MIHHPLPPAASHTLSCAARTYREVPSAREPPTGATKAGEARCGITNHWARKRSPRDWEMARFYQPSRLIMSSTLACNNEASIGAVRAELGNRRFRGQSRPSLSRRWFRVSAGGHRQFFGHRSVGGNIFPQRSNPGGRIREFLGSRYRAREWRLGSGVLLVPRPCGRSDSGANAFGLPRTDL